MNHYTENKVRLGENCGKRKGITEIPRCKPDLKATRLDRMHHPCMSNRLIQKHTWAHSPKGMYL